MNRARQCIGICLGLMSMGLLIFGAPAPGRAQEGESEDAKLFKALASPTPGVRGKAIADLAAQGDGTVAKLQDLVKNAGEGHAQAVAVLVKVNTDAAWAAIGEWLGAGPDEVRRRAIFAVGDLWREELLPAVEALQDLPAPLAAVRGEALEAFAALPRTGDAAELLTKAREPKSRETLAKLWQVSLKDPETGKETIAKNGVRALRFGEYGLDPQVFFRVLTPVGAWEAAPAPASDPSAVAFHFQEAKALKPGKSAEECTGDDIRRGYYAAGAEACRKNTPAYWIWVERAGNPIAERHIALWMDPCRLAARLPLRLRDFPEDNAGSSYVPTGSLEEKLKKIEWKQIEILVVTGDWDHIEKVFTELAIPHRLIAKGHFPQLLDGKPVKTQNEPKQEIASLDPARHVLIINCAEFNLNDRGKAALREFVGQGGYLLTTDWAITVLEQTFPDYVQRDKKGSISNTYKVKVNPAKKDHILLQDVQHKDDEFDWWFEPDSWGFLEKHPDCESLVLCPSLKNIPVVVTWRYQAPAQPQGKPGGKVTSKKEKAADGSTVKDPATPDERPLGRVLHYISHLEQQEKDDKGNYNLQMCFINFLKLKELESQGVVR